MCGQLGWLQIDLCCPLAIIRAEGGKSGWHETLADNHGIYGRCAYRVFVNHLCGYGGRPPYILDDDGKRCSGYGLSSHICDVVALVARSHS